MAISVRKNENIARHFFSQRDMKAIMKTTMEAYLHMFVVIEFIATPIFLSKSIERLRERSKIGVAMHATIMRGEAIYF